jgi:hypothetical protein
MRNLIYLKIFRRPERRRTVQYYFADKSRSLCCFLIQYVYCRQNGFPTIGILDQGNYYTAGKYLWGPANRFLLSNENIVPNYFCLVNFQHE